jgi:hypothetical protein
MRAQGQRLARIVAIGEAKVANTTPRLFWHCFDELEWVSVLCFVFQSV